MTNETKAKWLCRWNKFKEALVPIFIGGTIGAAWSSYFIGGMWNAHDISKLQKHERQQDAALEEAKERIGALERQNAQLMEEALKRTNGEAE